MESSTSSSTSDKLEDYASLTSEAAGYVFENGRRYHAYKAGRYFMPNDEHEMDREDMKHHIAMLITEGNLHMAPIGPNPEVVLDVGTGTGIWAIDMADAYPNSQIIATDLSPIQPMLVPPNVVIEIDDSEDEWLYKPGSIDFVHARYMFMAIRNWPKLVNQAMKALKPGGWIELVDMRVVPNSYDNSIPANSQAREFSRCATEMGSKIGLDLDVAIKFKRLLGDTGFEEIQEVVYDIPMGDWSEDRRMKEIGHWHRFQYTQGLSGIVTALFTRVGGWTKERLEVFMAGIRKEVNDKNIHMVYKLYFTYGRKPLVPAQPPSE